MWGESDGSLRWHGDLAKPLPELVPIGAQLIHRQRCEHLGQRLYREIAKEPCEDSRVGTRVLAQRKLEVVLGAKTSTFEEQKIDEITGLRTREDACELRGADR